MMRIIVAVGVALLTTTSLSWAQSQANCEQIKQAVAQYGYNAARAHAMANYGAEAVRAGDQCLGRGGGGRAAARHARYHHKTKHHH